MTQSTSDKKLWGGRFAEATDGLVELFNASVGFDQRLAEQDIRGSLAHVAMLGQVGILTPDEVGQIQEGLRAILADIRAGEFEWRLDREDVHMNVEAALRDRIGPVAGKLHTARSRNDQVAVDFRLFTKEAALDLAEKTRALRAVMVGEAGKHLTSDGGEPIILPGYTHLQVAQPILLSHWFMAYAAMLERDEGRFRDAAERMDESPLGSSALAGTPWPLDRHATAAALGFARPTANSLDGVGSRDFALEFLSACAILAAHLSRLSEELILYSTFEFGFLTLPDSHTTGSSIMPQKKNPDVSELARGKAGRVFGNLMGLLTVVKGTPLAYNKDLQEDKEGVFDSYDTLSVVLRLYADMLPKTVWHAGATKAAAARGFSTATDLADFLARSGVPFREAHEVVGGLVGLASRTGRQLWDLTDEELRSAHPLLNAGVARSLTVEESVKARQSYGGTAPERVREQVEAAKAALS
ncbi:argininosuccinate lyase [Deinococcus metallilatus]|uniref:Argininosuccinate lyase n=1 Tax=Deinococcus metallilatus TaxID=1211322 RepID=A0AAJ5F0U6_9DEIO|nr:argininosuccinate lyase [Deinococcus metallilatus]MBB5296184.1 argininosuccinate lyase [Deinococcus metallilatus]QBY09768.1 argininosuccinate lyase [Deinococcus metallilatus]RXJ08966.1 argininosuccinate lyase [Deinococcus metallilatus]TLK23655.1 argininosuccinate lyase [Deinococcus metallilatus]GMA14050.1 argininosuccinate lyase [Deinococcus metallilatus]